MSEHTKELIRELDAIIGSATIYPSSAQGQTIGQETWRITLSGNSLQSITDATNKLSELERQRDALRVALAQIVKIGAEHREGRLKALEWMAALESRLREIGDLAASCRTGPALREAMAQIETMTDMRHNVVVDAAIYCSEKGPTMNKWKLVPVEPPSEGQIRAIYTAMLEAAPQPQRLSDERIREIWVDHGLDDECVEGFARAIEREILGE